MNDGSLDAETVHAIHDLWARIGFLTPDLATRENAWRRRALWATTPTRASVGITRRPVGVTQTPAVAAPVAPLALVAPLHAVPLAQTAPSPPSVPLAPAAPAPPDPTLALAAPAPPAPKLAPAAPAGPAVRGLPAPGTALLALEAPPASRWAFDVIWYTREEVARSFAQLASELDLAVGSEPGSGPDVGPEPA